MSAVPEDLSNVRDSFDTHLFNWSNDPM